MTPEDLFRRAEAEPRAGEPDEVIVFRRFLDASAYIARDRPHEDMAGIYTFVATIGVGLAKKHDDQIIRRALMSDKDKRAIRPTRDRLADD